MPLYRLGPEPVFPPPELAEPEGLLAIGGDLSAERLLAAYRPGDLPLVRGRRPDPLVVAGPPARPASPTSCGSRVGSPGRSARAASRPATIPPSPTSSGPAPRLLAQHEDGTWITPEMQRAYIRLHELGHAHCMESWREGRLVGGIYGVRVGRVFCGESMFHHETDASKVALAALVERLQARGGRPDRLPGRERASDQPGGSGDSPGHVPAPPEVGTERQFRKSHR